jgi:hypothetical protein
MHVPNQTKQTNIKKKVEEEHELIRSPGRAGEPGSSIGCYAYISTHSIRHERFLFHYYYREREKKKGVGALDDGDVQQI